MNDIKEDIDKNYKNEEYKKKCNFSKIKIKEEIDKIKEEEEKKQKEEEEKKKVEEKKEENKEEKKEEKKEEIEGAVYIPPKRPKTPPKIEEISLIPEIIIKYEYNQKIEMGEYSIPENNEFIFTKNNSLSIDLDEYFEESLDILKQYNLIKEEKKDNKEEKEEIREIEDEDEIEDNNLIDELFNEIGMDEEEKKEEEKKEGNEEKKEEEKKGDKMEEEKEEEKKEDKIEEEINKKE